jgi:anti-sigma-K factor RskA
MSQLIEMTQSHVRHLAADYVLNLLPAEERRRVEEHSLECAACRHAILSDRRLAASVRLALLSAGRPAAGRLQQLMPKPNSDARAGNSSFSGRLLEAHRSAILALCMMVFILSVGSMLLGGYKAQQAITPHSVATQLAATATGPAVTATAVPSATSTQSAGVEFTHLLDIQHQYRSPSALQSIGTPVASAAQSRSLVLFP